MSLPFSRSICRGLALVAILLIAAVPVQAMVPSLAPSATFADDDAWFVHARVHGARASGEACAGAAELREVTVGFVGGSRTIGAAAGQCITVEHAFTASTPGLLQGYARAVDESGLAAADVGAFDVQLLPFDTSTIVGFPPLGSVAPAEPFTSVFMEMMMKTDGSIRAYRVGFGGHLALDTYPQHMPAIDDKIVRITFDSVASQATVEIDAAVVWEGLVHQVDERWWHLRPLAPASA